MTPTYLGFLLLTGCAGAICAAPRWPRSARTLALIPLACLFIWLYIWVADEVAQDRSTYYLWYQEAAYRAADPLARDPVFTGMLLQLPDGLTAPQFGAILSLAVFALVVAVLYRLAALRILSTEMIPFAILALICDRQFLDLTLNSTRSSIAALVFFLAVLSKTLPLRLLLCGVAIGIHGRLALILLIVYTFAVLMWRMPRVLWLGVFLGVGAMLTRLLTGGVLLPEIDALSTLLSATDSESSGGVLAAESVARGLTINSELSVSLAAQIAIGILLPAALVARHRNQLTIELPPEAARMQATLVSFALISTSTAMLFYPELALASRLFIVPLMVFPVLLPEHWLKLLVVAKSLLISLILQQHLT